MAPPSTMSVWPVIRAARSDERKSTALPMSRAPWRRQRIDGAHRPLALGLVLVATADVARSDSVDADAMAAHLVGEGPNQGDDPRLGGPVGRMEARRRDPVHRGDGHDAASGALADHVTSRGPEQIEDLGQVVLDRPDPILIAEVLGFFPEGLADDVDAHVDATQQARGLVEGPLDLLAVRHVRDHREGFAAGGLDLRDDGLGPTLVEVDAGHCRPGLGQAQSTRAAMAGPPGDVPRTGHHRSFAAEAEVDHGVEFPLLLDTDRATAPSPLMGGPYHGPIDFF